LIEQRKIDVVSQALVVIALLVALKLGLLPALLAGLLVHELVDATLPRLRRIGLSEHGGKVLTLAVFTISLITLIVLAVLGLRSLLVGQEESLKALLDKMAEILDTARNQLPPGIQAYIPANTEELQHAASEWLRTHGAELQQAATTVGLGAVRSVFMIVIAMVIGGLIAVRNHRPDAQRRPLAGALADRAAMLAQAFRRVVFAQAQISALNTLLTAIYLAGVLPLFGIHLPLLKTVIALTFVVGLLPIIGNLVSNTVIVVISLSVSLYAALAALAFLILIHKLEYFVNARLMGRQIHARAWELLLAMLVMDAAFGLPGLVAAPIYYGYLKDELAARGLV
jgi:predicted PurR-regulated permease PerM